MQNIGCGLSEQEIERLCKLPRVDKDEEYAMALVMLESRKEQWAESHPGETVIINARTLEHSFGSTFDKAMEHHVEEHDRSLGDPMLAQYLKPC